MQTERYYIDILAFLPLKYFNTIKTNETNFANISLRPKLCNRLVSSTHILINNPKLYNTFNYYLHVSVTNLFCEKLLSIYLF